MAQQQIRTDRDLQNLKRNHDYRWSAFVTWTKCISLGAFAIVAWLTALAILLFIGTVIYDYYFDVIKADLKKLEIFCEWLVSHAISLGMGAIPPIVYIKAKNHP